MGKLQEMLDKQEALQKRLGYDFDKLSYEERTALIKEFSLHTMQEINELLYELPYFKPWKDYSGMSGEEMATALQAAQGEFIDTMHFMYNIALLLGFDEATMHGMYMNKNKENHNRQDEGYTHDKSYREGN